MSKKKKKTKTEGKKQKNGNRIKVPNSRLEHQLSMLRLVSLAPVCHDIMPVMLPIPKVMSIPLAPL